MRILAGFLFFLCLLTTSCAPLSPPDPATLTACFTAPFTAGYTLENRETGETQTGMFSRTDTGDTVTVTGKYGNTVFVFSGDTVSLCAGDAPDAAHAVTIPVSLPQDAPILLCRRLLSRIPCDTDTVQRKGDGYTLTSADGVTVHVSPDGTPRALTQNAHTLTLHSFQTEAT